VSIVVKPRWFTVKQAAAELGYSLTKTKRLVTSGDLKSVKDGGSRRVLPRWIDEYIEALAQQVEEAHG